MARMQAIIRRSKGFSQPSLRVGPLLLNLDSHEVSVHGELVHLTGKEYSILELLVLRKGMVLTKEAFLNHLYGGMDEPEMKIIDVFICKLRKKLALAGAEEPDWHCLGPGLHDQGAGGERDTDARRYRGKRTDRCLTGLSGCRLSGCRLSGCRLSG